MTNVCTLPSLRLLDLGYNSIRHITGVQSLSHLQKLFLGRNKIETISVFSFTNVSFRDWRDFTCAFSISKATEFARRAVSRRSSIFRNCIFRDGGEMRYLAYNGIPKIEGMEMLRNVNTLDLTHNYLTDTQGMQGFASLEFLWVGCAGRRGE